MAQAQCVDGVWQFPSYKGNVGPVRFSLQHTNATIACMLNRNDGSFTGLSAEELQAWHECLSWLREPGHNKWVYNTTTNYEQISSLWDKLQLELNSRNLIPEGDKQTHITFVPKFGSNVPGGVLGETLGDEHAGIVVVTDATGKPDSFRNLQRLQHLEGTQEYRVEVRLPTSTGQAWCKRHQDLETSDCAALGADWRTDLASGAQCHVEQAWVHAGDAHFEAKCLDCRTGFGYRVT